MGFGHYIRQRLGEFVLLVVSAGCFALVAQHAFFLESMRGMWPATIAATAVLLAVLYAAAWRRAGIAGGIVAYVLLCAALIAASLALSSGESIYDDAEGNYLYWALVVVASATASFLLNRSLPGSVLWFLAVAFCCSIIEGFYKNGALAESLLAGGAALALVVYRNFNKALYAADVAQDAAARGRFATAIATVAGVLAAAAALWFLVIAPLNPPVMKIALITDYRQLPIVEMRGVADEQPELDLSLTSDQLIEGFRYTTDNLLEGASDVVMNAQQVLDRIMFGGGTTSSGEGAQSGTTGGLDDESLDEEYDTQAYTTVFPVGVIILLAVLGVAALVAAIVALVRWRRRRRLRGFLAADSPTAQIQSLYPFLVSRLAKAGITIPSGTTLREFSDNASLRLAPYDAEAKAAFASLTRSYEACTYGQASTQPADVVPFVSYYLSFWKVARSQLGNLKYLTRIFWL